MPPRRGLGDRRHAPKSPDRGYTQPREGGRGESSEREAEPQTVCHPRWDYISHEPSLQGNAVLCCAVLCYDREFCVIVAMVYLFGICVSRRLWFENIIFVERKK